MNVAEEQLTLLRLTFTAQSHSLKDNYETTVFRCRSDEELPEERQPRKTDALYNPEMSEEERDVIKQLLRGQLRHDALPKQPPTSVDVVVCYAEESGT